MNRFASQFKPLTWFLAMLLSAFVAGCGGGGDGGGGGTAAPGGAVFGAVLPGAPGTPGAAATNPTVGSASPASGATNVATSTNGPGNVVTGKTLTATFTQAMDPTSITTVGVFTLKQTVAGTDVPGTVTMDATNTVATFTPTAAALLAGTQYTATITTVAKNAGGTSMPSPISWSFTTNAAAQTTQGPVNLGAAGNFTILTKTGISATGTAGTLVTGDIGVSPALAGSITGFALSAPPTTFTTSALVVGRVFAADYNPPTPANLTTAVANMETAFTDAAGRPAGVGPNLNLLGGNLTPAQTLAPGVYTWNVPGNVSISTNLTLTGSADDVWIFQITGTLDLEANVQIILAGGAQAKNVFWQVSGAVTLKPNSHFEGVVLAQTNIAMQTSATATARFLAQTQVALDGNPITAPAP